MRTRVGRGGARSWCGPKPLCLSKPKDKAVVAGQQTVLQGVPGHVCGRPRTGYLGADGPQSTGPANRNAFRFVKDELSTVNVTPRASPFAPDASGAIEPEVTSN